MLVPEGLLLRRRGGPSTSGDATESEVSGRGLDSVVLRLAHVRLSDLPLSGILLTFDAFGNRDVLMEEFVRVCMQNMLQSTTTMKRTKSVYQSKNLGTIKNRKKQKQGSTKEGSNGEVILRILRMRYLSWAGETGCG